MFRIPFLAVLFAALLAGCATTSQVYEIQNFNGGNETVLRSIRPVTFFGVLADEKWVKFYRTKNFVGVYVEMPMGADELLPDYHPNREDYLAYAVGSDGREYEAQLLFQEFLRCQPTGLLVIGGTTTLAGIKAIAVSTANDKAFRLLSEEGKTTAISGFDGERFNSNVQYRQEFIRKNGSPVDFDSREVRSASALFAEFSNRMIFDRLGIAAAPEKTALIRSIAGENPTYTFGEKIEHITDGVISTPTAMAVSYGLEAIMATQEPSRGLDGHSVAVREELASHLEYFYKLRDQAMNRKECK